MEAQRIYNRAVHYVKDVSSFEEKYNLLQIKGHLWRVCCLMNHPIEVESLIGQCFMLIASFYCNTLSYYENFKQTFQFDGLLHCNTLARIEAVSGVILPFTILII